MAPNVQFLGMGLYEWMIVAGVILAMVVLRLCSGRAGLSARVFNLTLFSGVVSVVVGYLFAVLFQSFYSFLETGVYTFGTGATFYGGFIGGAGCFLILYFAVGRILIRDGEHVAQFWKMSSLAAPCIALAHGMGRIGCLLGGCCYGIETDGFGVPMYVDGVWESRLPVQLFEAVFLFLLFAVMLFLVLKLNFSHNLSAYLIGYGVWRFFIEYLRGDDRGSTGTILSPSQLTAVLLIAAGVAIVIFRFVSKRGKRHEGA